MNNLRLILSVLSLSLCFGPLAGFASESDTIKFKAPDGMVPVLKKGADGIWIIELKKLEEAAEAEEEKPAESPGKPEPDGKSASTSLDDTLAEKIKTLDWETPVPSSPAFTALGMSPESVASPTTLRELALSLLNGADRQGRIQTGFALDVSPYAMLNPDLSAREYRANWLARALYNTTVSLGTSQVTEEGDAQRIALGFSMRLWNSEEDDFNAALSKIGSDLWQSHPPAEDDPFTDADDAAAAAADAASTAEVDEKLTRLFSDLRARTWGRGTASIAWAPTWLSESGKWNDLRYDGSTAWAAASFQLNGPTDDELAAMAASPGSAAKRKKLFHLLTQAQYRDAETVTGSDEDKTEFEQDSLLLAARLRYGTVDLNGSFEMGYLRIWDGPNGDGNAVRFGVSLEKRISDGTWLVVSVGQDMGISGDIEDESFAVGGIRFGFGQQPTPETREAIANAGKR